MASGTYVEWTLMHHHLNIANLADLFAFRSNTGDLVPQKLEAIVQFLTPKILIFYKEHLDYLIHEHNELFVENSVDTDSDKEVNVY